MRNLKKILALVLALVMSLSLMATAGAADAGANGEQITPAYQTALDVLGKEGLKVFEGYSDGTFKPQQPITRAEVATILYRIATGDVNGTQSGIYTDMASTKFTDLEGANWARGYINYCANAELIVGVGNNKFQPSQNITGYATLAMVLRALGYDKAGEFRGSGWEIRTASLAKSLGITNNITDAQLGGAATREVVAEILFRAILNETVTYSALTSGGYTKTGETLAKKNLGLDDIVGVVTANEWADLYDDEPLAKDKTRLDVDGKNFNLDITSDAALLGTSVHAYVKDGRALTGLEDSGRNTIQNSEGAAAEVAKLKGGLKLTEGTEYMINFSEAGEVDYSDWRIEYVIELESDADRTLVEGNGGEWEADGKTYNKVIKVGQKITKVDMTLIQRIFYGSDNKAVDSADGVYDGEVYVGTKSTLGKDDISDEISYREFVSKYLNADSVKFDDSDNGESLRVIDNNNDGVAEYVLRVDFVMTTITDYNSRTETWTVEYDNTEIKNSEIATEEELAVGDVILYTYIDGVYHISFPETATESIAKRGIDYKKNTINCGDNTYTWSGIDRLAARYYQEITEVEVETSYTLFLDRYGYVRLATEANKGLALLTDAYYGTDWRNGDYRVETWAMGAEEATDVTVTADKGLSAWTRYADRTLDTDKAYDGFIDTYEERDHGNAGTWDRLHEFGQYRYGTLDQIGTQDDINGHYTGWSNGGNGTDPFRTNVAAYVEKDGEWTLYDVTANNSSRTNYHSYEIYDTGVDGSVSAKDRTMYGVTAWNNDAKTVNTDENVRIQANTSTQYYWVQFNSRGEISKVESWTGYTNAPSDFIPERGYAITSEVADMNDRYQVAEVVVFEDAYEEDFLRAWFVNAYRDNRSLLTAGWDGETYTSDVTIDSNVLNTGKLFEFVDADGDVISANYGKYHVYAGVVMTEGRILNGDYVALSRSTTTAIPREGEHFNSGVYADKVWKEFIFGEIPVYRLNDRVVGKLNSDGRDLEECTPRMDDLVLYMTNEKGEVALVIDVTQSEETAVYNSMLALWNEVVLDYYPTLSVSVTNKDGVGPDEYNYPANHTYPINNGTVKIPASVFEAEGWTVAEKGIWVVRYGENSTYDRAGWLTEGGEEYFVIEGIKGVIGVEIEWVKVEAPEELDKDGAKAEIDGYRADEVAALTGDDAKAAADAKATAKAAVDAATTQEEIDKAIADYKAAIDEILTGEEPKNPITVTFQYATGSEKKFNNVDLTLPTAQEVMPGETVTVTGIPTADTVKDEMSNLQTYLILLSKEDPDAEDTTEADVYTMDQYTTPATITAGDTDMIVYCYYGVTTLSGEGEPDDPVIPPPDDDGIIVLSLDEGIQTLAIDKPAPVETYTTWILAPKAIESLTLEGEGTLYTDVVGPTKYDPDGDVQPANAGYVLGAAEKYAETHNLWWVTYKMAEGQTWVKPGVSKDETPEGITVTVNGENITVDPVKDVYETGDVITITPAENFAIETATAAVGSGAAAGLELEADGSVKYTVPETTEAIVITVATKSTLTLNDQVNAAKAEAEKMAAEAKKNNPDLNGAQIAKIDAALAEVLNALNAAFSEDAIQAAMETFEKKLADAIAGKNSEIDKEAGTINLDWWLDPAWGLTDIDADHLVALLTAENPDMTFASAKITTATAANTGVGAATILCDGEIYIVNLQRFVKVSVDGKEVGVANLGATTLNCLAKGAYVEDTKAGAAAAANLYSGAVVANDGANVTVSALAGDVKLVSVIPVTVETATQRTVTSFEITYTGCEDVTVSTVSDTAYARKGAVLEIAAINATADNGSYYQLKLTQDAGQTAEKVLNTFERQFVAGGDNGKTPDFNLPVEAEWTNVQISYLQGFMIKYGAKELGVVAKGANKTLDVTGKGLADGNYVPVTKDAAHIADASLITVATAAGAATLTLKADASFAENANGDMSIVPAVQVTASGATGTSAAYTYGDITEGVAISDATYVAAGAVVTFTQSDDSWTEGDIIVQTATDANSKAVVTKLEGVEDAEGKMTFETTLEDGYAYTYSVASAADVEGLALEVGTDLNESATSGKFAEVDFETAKADVTLGAVYEFEGDDGVIRVPGFDAFMAAVGDGTLAKGDVITVTVTLTAADGKYFAARPVVGYDETVCENWTEVWENETLTITFDITLTDNTSANT